jgi:cell division transport system permease protein
MRANFVLSGVWAGIRRNATMTVALILSTSIALAFVGAAMLANTEISQFKKVYESKINVSVYLCTSYAYDTQVHDQQQAAADHKKQRPLTCAKSKPTTDAQRADIESKLKSSPYVTRVKYVSSQEALDNAIKIGLSGAKDLTVGQLPDSYTIKLKDVKRDYAPFAAAFADVQGIDQVNNQIDTIKPVLDVIDGARLFSILIAAIVLVASVLLIANTIQVAAAQRRNETSIMRLVGASRWMTELPFMLETLIATFVGGLVSFGLLALGKAYVLDGIFGAQVTRKTIPNLKVNDVLIAGGVGMGVGLVLAAVTAFATLRLYVRL